MSGCVKDTQFAVAKKQGSGECQWKIKRDFSPVAGVTKTDLMEPIEDANKNCYFACAIDKKKTSHTEKVINRFLMSQNILRSDFDLYTYLSPCDKCIHGSDDKGKVEKADLDQYNKVYFTEPTDRTGRVQPYGYKLENDELLTGGIPGLTAIGKNSKVDLEKVKSVIEKGKKEKKTKMK